MNGRAVIIGASYAGLSTAATFRAKGWEVIVVEKSTDLSRSGGGVVVQKQMADYLENHGIAHPRITAVPARMRRMFQPDGSVLDLPETAVAYTAWDTLLKEIEETVGSGNIHRGCTAETIETDSSGVIVTFADGATTEADLVIAADGIGSGIRRVLLPEEYPTYAGYVAWRGMVPESVISTKMKEHCTDSLCTFTGRSTNIVVYEVPGEDGSVEPGKRRINWVWYRNVQAGSALHTLLTDRTGQRHRATLSRGQIPNRLDGEIREAAKEELLPHFSVIVEETPELFVQAIFDYQASALVFDRTVLIGDAACLVRPHIGAGTAKAVDDAIKLADAIAGPDYRGRGCLRSWETRQQETHYGLMEQSKALARRIGLGVELESPVYMADPAEVSAV